MAELHIASRADLLIVVKTCMHMKDMDYDGTDHSSYNSANIV